MTGRNIGQYEIVDLLGKGGMGEVYRARDTRLGREVALKLLPAELSADSGLRNRLEQEARAVASLQHPNIVTLFSVEEDQERLFLTMELLSGPTLKEVIPENGMPVDELLKLAAQLAGAVGSAHDKNIIHRDLKPSNIMFTAEGHLKILDFGLAKQVDPGGGLSGDDRTMTSAGTILGTFAYMAPEQAEGEPVTTSADVFALGTLLYEMSTGKQPFQGKTAVGLLSAVVKDTPPDMLIARPDLPPAFAEIVQRCHQKNPAQRFANASELHVALRALRTFSGDSPGSGESVSSGEASREVTSHPGTEDVTILTTPSARAGKRRPLIIGATLVVAALAIWGVATQRTRPAAERGGVTNGIRNTPDAEVQHLIVVFPFENLGAADDGYFADGMTAEIISHLTSVPGISVIARTTAKQYARAGKTTQEIADDLGVDHVLEGTIRWDRSGGRNRVRITPQLVRVADGVNVWASSLDRNLNDVFAMQSEIATAVVGAVDATLVTQPSSGNDGRTNNLEAYDAYLRAQEFIEWGTGPTRKSLHEGIVLLEQAVLLDGEFALAHAAISSAYSALYRYERLESQATAAQAAASRALQLAPDVAASHLAMGLYRCRVEEDVPAALEDLERGRLHDPNSSEIMSWTGTLFKRMGNLEKAEETLLAALRLDPRSPTILSELATVNALQLDFEIAIQYLDRVLEIRPTVSTQELRAFIIFNWKGDPGPYLRHFTEQEPTNIKRLRAHFFARQFDEVFRVSEEFREQGGLTQSELIQTWLHPGLVHALRGDMVSAGVVAGQLATLVDSTFGFLSQAHVHVLQGENAKALAIIEAEIVSRPLQFNVLVRNHRAFTIAMLYSIMGMKREAIELLEPLQGVSDRLMVPRLEVDPSWDLLRGSPEWEAFMERARARRPQP